MVRIPEGQKILALRAYAEMGGIEWVTKKYPTWFHALEGSGVFPDGVQSTARGFRCLAADGHFCLSLDEQFIDNWLTSHSVPHEREPFYPRHPSLNMSGRRRADWEVGSTFIEYFGLRGDPEYDRRADEKLRLARASGVNVISIYPEDLAKLESILPKVLKALIG